MFLAQERIWGVGLEGSKILQQALSTLAQRPDGCPLLRNSPITPDAGTKRGASPPSFCLLSIGRGILDDCRHLCHRH
jgi:hypothetical protein